MQGPCTTPSHLLCQRRRELQIDRHGQRRKLAQAVGSLVLPMINVLDCQRSYELVQISVTTDGNLSALGGCYPKIQISIGGSLDFTDRGLWLSGTLESARVTSTLYHVSKLLLSLSTSNMAFKQSHGSTGLRHEKSFSPISIYRPSNIVRTAYKGLNLSFFGVFAELYANELDLTLFFRSEPRKDQPNWQEHFTPDQRSKTSPNMELEGR